MIVKLIGPLDNTCYVNLSNVAVVDLDGIESGVCIIDGVIYTASASYLHRVKRELEKMAVL